MAISIQAVMALNTLTSQNRPLPTKPWEVRQVWARNTKSLPTGETGISKSL